MRRESYDFCGYATKNDLLCTDGRTIRQDAFKGCDGTIVPLVWNHRHDDPEMVIGHALLENREDGVFMYGKINDTVKGRACKELLKSKDINGLSIWANQLKQKAGNVLHGVIQEVSLVLKGANPGALIDFSMAHADGVDDEMYAYLIGDEYTELSHNDEGIIVEYDDPEEDEEMYDDYDEEVYDDYDEAYEDEDLQHADDDKEETIAEIFDTLTDKQKDAVYAIIAAMEEEKSSKSEDNKEMAHADDGAETVSEVFDTLTDKQKEAVYVMIAALEDEKADKDDDDDDDEEGEKAMKHNAFEGNNGGATLSHSDETMILEDAVRMGSLKAAIREHQESGVLAHSAEGPDDYGVTRGVAPQSGAKYGIYDPDFLFPEYKAISEIPSWIKRDTGWVSDFMGACKHTPFSRIKSLHADITAEDARALGYIKGNLKKDEFFTLIKRTTDPQTVYKKQAMDKDDIRDITGFDVVAWIRGEMRIMLEEEIARAALIGDGRSTASPEKISEAHIRPIAKDSDLYAVKVAVEGGANVAKNFIRAALRARKEYKGSGNPNLYTTEDMLTEMLLIEDGLGHFMYANQEQLAATLRVRKIVTVPVMEGATIPITTTSGASSTTTNQSLYGIIVNPQDYVVGADKGGSIENFDDFDIEYNKERYLMETRCSGALVVPYSALVLYEAPASGSAG